MMIQWQWIPGDSDKIQHFDYFLNGTRYRYSHIYYHHNHYKFINIQKNASTSWKYWLKYPLKNRFNDYYFTILREPLQRLKSIFYFNYHSKNWPIEDQGKELIQPKNFLQDYQQFCHFLPQYMHLEPFKYRDIHYYDMQDIPKLLKTVLLKMPRAINSTNVSNPSQAVIEQVEVWIIKHRSFIDDFLAPDIELYHNKIIKPSLK